MVISMLSIGIAIASIMSYLIQKETLYSITEFGTERTAEIIHDNLKAAMLSGRHDIQDSAVIGKSKSGKVESVMIYDSEGRPAFQKDAPVQEGLALKELKSGRDRYVIREPRQFTYFMPLKNDAACHSCHDKNKNLLGAVRITLDIHKEYDRAMSLIGLVILITIAAVISFSIVLWYLLKKMVIKPVQSIEAAAVRIAEGNLTFDIVTSGDDEIGRTNRLLGESFNSFNQILHGIKQLSKQILSVVQKVEQQVQMVLAGAEKEAEATADISDSLGRLNSTSATISANTQDLAQSAELSSGSIEQMLKSIHKINESMQELDGVVDITSTVVERLTKTVMELSEKSTDLYGSSEETFSAITEVVRFTKDVEAGTRESAAISEQVKTEAGTIGMSSVTRTLEGMSEIDASVKQAAERIEALSKRSMEIEKILKVIKNLNDETTLLSLNASILASKAGIHGKGFAVVATEMKDLSERTDSQAEEIAILIQAIKDDVRSADNAMKKGIRSVESGMKLAHETESALQRVFNSSTESSEKSAQINRLAEAQTHAAEQVILATERVREMVSIIVDAISEQADSTMKLSDARHRLKELSGQVSRATEEQASSSSSIIRTTKSISQRSQEISFSLEEHKKGSDTIFHSIEKVKDIPEESRDLALHIISTVVALKKDAELLDEQMKKFHLSSDGSGNYP